MTLPRFAALLPALALFLAVSVPGLALASDLTRFRDLKNEYIKVTDVKEREKSEEKYVDTGGRVELKKIPYKEILVTAELIRKPPSTMENMFGDTATEPYFKVCLVPFDAADKALEEDCQSLRFQSLVAGNVGTAAFRLSDDMARYELRLTQKVPDKGSTIKLWYPSN